MWHKHIYGKSDTYCPIQICYFKKNSSYLIVFAKNTGVRRDESVHYECEYK